MGCCACARPIAMPVWSKRREFRDAQGDQQFLLVALLQHRIQTFGCEPRILAKTRDRCFFVIAKRQSLCFVFHGKVWQVTMKVRSPATAAARSVQIRMSKTIRASVRLSIDYDNVDGSQLGNVLEYRIHCSAIER